MSGRIAGADRETFRALVDELLPAAHGMPSGAEAGVADAGLDRVLDLRGDLIEELLRGLRLVRGEPQTSALMRLKTEDAGAWHAIRLAALGAYYTTPAVQERLGYTGQLAHPYDPDAVPEYATNGMLDRVKARGRCWQQIPEG